MFFWHDLPCPSGCKTAQNQNKCSKVILMQCVFLSAWFCMTCPTQVNETQNQNNCSKLILMQWQWLFTLLKDCFFRLSVEKVWYTSFLSRFLLSVVHELMLWEACGLQWCLWNDLQQGLIIKTCNWKKHPMTNNKTCETNGEQFLMYRNLPVGMSHLADCAFSHYDVVFSVGVHFDTLQSHELVFSFMDCPNMPK